VVEAIFDHFFGPVGVGGAHGLGQGDPGGELLLHEHETFRPAQGVFEVRERFVGPPARDERLAQEARGFDQ
jgi:hypothetical protein